MDAEIIKVFRSPKWNFINDISRTDYNKLYSIQIIQEMSETNMNQLAQPQIQQAQQPQTSQQQNNQNQDLANCDLANLESLNCNDSDELLRQLTENTFELETFFEEFSTADIKARAHTFVLNSANAKQFVNFQEENNNEVIDSSNHNPQDNFTNCNDINVEANLAILQNRLLASSKYGINIVRGKSNFEK